MLTNLQRGRMGKIIGNVAIVGVNDKQTNKKYIAYLTKSTDPRLSKGLASPVLKSILFIEDYQNGQLVKDFGFLKSGDTIILEHDLKGLYSSYTFKPSSTLEENQNYTYHTIEEVDFLNNGNNIKLAIIYLKSDENPNDLNN